ncbi:MAG: polymerase beta chain [Pseudomonadota bacterium]|jgi:DNA polymerase-3 subunit beta
MSDNNFHILVETRDLSRILMLSGSIVEKRNVLPILSHIKLEAIQNKLILTATDMDLAVRFEIGADVKQEGTITVHNQTFADVMRKITDKTLELEFLEPTSQLELRAQNCKVALSTLPSHEFPIMDNFNPKLEFNLHSKTLVELLEFTKFAISTEETRYNLNGVFLHSSLVDGKQLLAAAATDGHRLASSRSDVEVPGEFGIILPRKTVQEVHKILKDSQMLDSVVHIAIGHNRVSVACDGMGIISKLIDGSFPDYQVFIPVSNENKLTLPGALLKEAVDRVATVAAEKFPAIKLSVMEDQLELHAHGEAKGLANEVIQINGSDIKYSGNQVTIGFNPRYILDVLSTVSGEVTVFLADSFSPALLKSSEHPNTNFVVMPVKV